MLLAVLAANIVGDQRVFLSPESFRGIVQILIQISALFGFRGFGLELFGFTIRGRIDAEYGVIRCVNDVV